MAISFKESKQAVTPSAAHTNASRSVKPAMASYSVSDGYTLCSDGRYEVYSQYYDDKFSSVDDQKNINIDPAQIDIAQEENSQYKVFRISRYQDGIDLMDMLIQIHYVNKDGSGDVANAMNVEYNDEYIRFGWLIGAGVTAVAGTVTFEITATGMNEKNQPYRWRTRPNGKFTVFEALSYDHMIEPSDDWYTSFETMILGYVSQASQYAQEAKDSAASVDAETLKKDVETAVTGTLDEKITGKLSAYSTQTEVNQKVSELREAIGKIDSLSRLKVDYDNATGTLTFINQESESVSATIAFVKINSLSNLRVAYSVVNGRGTLTFKNGESEITSVEMGNADPSAEWTNAFRETVKGDIRAETAKVETAVDALKTTVEALDVDAVKTDLTAARSDISDLKADVSSATASASEAKNAVDVLKKNVENNASDIQVLNTGLSGLEAKVDGIETQPSNTYDVNYADNLFTLYENDEVKRQFTITGGGGGTVDTSTITIERVTPANLVILSDGTAVIEYNFTSVDNAGDATGNGTAVWKVGNTVVATETAVQGKNRFDITKYLKTGQNNIRLTITDSFGTISAKTWTATVVEFKIESSFDDSLFYSGEVTFRYTPYGDISKQIVFELDGKSIGGITTTVTGRQMTQTIPAQTHGAHLLKVYMTAQINGQPVQSDPVYKDIIWIDADSQVPVIGCSVFDFAVKQGNAFVIPYTVYDPQHNPAAVTLSVDGKVVSALTVTRTQQIWSYKSATVGDQVLTIACGNVKKIITAHIEELGIDIGPVTTNLAFDFNPAGRSNGEADWLKLDDRLTIAVSDNFDKVNGGYQVDNDGDTYFCVKAGTTATIPYHLFADDAKKTGKNFKFVYKCTNVKDYEAQVLSCFSNSIGLRVNAQEAVLNSEQNSVNVQYCEDHYMELEFNVLPDSQFTEMVMWLDGVPQRVKIYSSSDSFTQTTPVGITIGSDDCDVYVYRMKSYTMNLTDDEILDNFIADAKNSDAILARYIRNNILDSSGNLDPDLLAEKCPDLRIIKIDAPRFTTGKKDKVASTSFQQIYRNGRDVDNWFSYGGVHSGQGTSSEYYGEAGRNLDLNCKGGFTFSDGATADKYGMTEHSVPVNYFNIKVNIASSENINNAGCAEEYNTYNPYIRKARVNDPRVRDTMEFHPCVVFIRETDTENAVEFTDGGWHFYACGNIGNSKKNSEAFGMDPDNHKEFIVEVSNNVDPQCRFLSDDLSNEGWDGDTSFEMRYENPNCTPEELQAGKDAWQALLTWVVNATPETFVAEFEDHFIKDSVLFYYLFTERHTLVDNRAKNTFWHTEDLIHWDLCFDYDNDTAMGNDNEGGLTLRYGYEDTDTIGTKAVFNASDSKLYCYVRDYMQDDLAAMFTRLESQGAWSAGRILTSFEAEQAMKPERLWIMDMRRKYFRPYEDNGTTSYLEMMHGDKKHQRRQFQNYQEKYMASKYVSPVCTSDVMTLRGYTPTNWTAVKPDGTFHVRPYADIYIVNRYGSNVTKVRAKRGNTYEIKSPVAAMNDTEVYTYSASMVQSIGDIAPFYPGYCDFNQGVKLTDLTIGSGVDGYSNTNMTDFGIGQNVLLERLNLQNLPNLKKTISLAQCINLEEFLADGSGITGVIFAPGGKIRVAHLPAIASLTANNLYLLEDLTISDYGNITTLSIDNCPAVDELDLLNQATHLTRLRLTGIHWNLDSTDLLDRLAGLAGIDENGYNTVTSVLAGSVHVPIMREQKLAHYNQIWPDLEITYDTMITQYKVTFQNADAGHTVLEIQYVDKGGDAVDPVTRKERPIPVPTLASTVSTNFTYSGWDESLTGVFADRVITATYTETTREYTVQYKSKGTVLQETKAPYGTSVPYTVDIPTYTAEESAYKYYLFSGWDQSGYVDGNKTINAVYQVCEYTEGCFDGKDLSQLSMAELYAMMKLGQEEDHLAIKDSIDLTLGNDYSFGDIEEKEIIGSDMKFDGTNHFDSEVSLFDVDRDFTLAIDYEFGAGNETGATLAQCFQYDGSNGFRLWWSSEPKLSWGTDSCKPSNGQEREIMVIRHKAGSDKITVVDSHLSGDDITSTTLSAIRNPRFGSNLVFGAARADDGIYENHATGIVHWCKIWYADLGDEMCSSIAQWPHETIPVELAKFRAYYLADTASKRASITFLASSLLGIKRGWTNKSTNEGGWASSSLNSWMNSRLYRALPPLWKAVIKPVKVYSSIGMKSNETAVSSCYFYAPSVYEVDGTMATEPYINETNAPVAYMLNDDSRKRAKDSSPDVYESYWTRSPNVQFTNYIWAIDENGADSGYSYPSYSNGILLMFSIGV